jgi:hypothetical protein
MEASSELPLAAESISSLRFAERMRQVDPHDFAGEEFPPNLPVTCEWMLQPASQRVSRRMLGLVAVMVAALLMAGSFCVVYWGPKLTPSALASPSSSR